jgi:hypothetical protein
VRERELIEPVLRRYTHLFHDEESTDFGVTNVFEHQIILADDAHRKAPEYDCVKRRNEVSC